MFLMKIIIINYEKKKIWVPSNWWKSKPARWPFCISVYDGAFYYYVCFIETKPTKTHYFLYKSLVKQKKLVSKNDQTTRTTKTFYLGFNINYICVIVRSLFKPLVLISDPLLLHGPSNTILSVFSPYKCPKKHPQLFTIYHNSLFSQMNSFRLFFLPCSYCILSCYF